MEAFSFSAQTLRVFFAASVALGCSPGPDNIFVLTQSVLHGRFAGLLVTLGLCTGLIVHTALVAVGVAAAIAASATAFAAIKFAGAAYLCFLAWRAFRASARPTTDCRSVTAGAGRLYARGVIMNLSNPKVGVFFLAFLPQFVDPVRGPVSAQIAVLGMVFIVAALLVFGAIAWFSGAIGEKFRSSPGARKFLNRVAGTVFIGLAARLILTELT